jgi:hypothetical protein
MDMISRKDTGEAGELHYGCVDSPGKKRAPPLFHQKQLVRP